MFQANFETVRYSFVAFGETEKEARDALAEGWRVHAEQAFFILYEDDVSVIEFQLGDCFRDKALLRRVKS